MRTKAAALLDVNVLIALVDPAHIHHDLAHDWFEAHRSEGWATCALTENAFVRILANPAYGSTESRPAALVSLLRTFCAGGHHDFWSETVSLRDDTLFDPAFVQGHRQLADVYLVGLAKKMGGRLATFDRTIPLKAVIGARPGILQVIAPPNLA